MKTTEKSDPNEGNPFEPPETDEQRARRIARIIRENADKKQADLPGTRKPSEYPD